MEFVGGPLDGQSMETSQPHDFDAMLDNGRVFAPTDSFAPDVTITGRYVVRNGNEYHWVPA
jgi:hypothetical protein